MTGRIEYIDNENSFEEFLTQITATKYIAVDLEFDRNHHHYGFSLCLMQIFCCSTAYLLDPFEVDIEKVFPFFEDAEIEKTVFSFGEDLRLLSSLGCTTKNIYDISLAVKLLNYQKISLADILLEEMNIKLEKGSQTSDWCRRPFSERQLVYAANDVLFLEELKTIIQQKIEDKGMEKWIEEENHALEKISYGSDETNSVKEKDKRKMTEFQWYFYRKLWEFREEIAEKTDKPPHRIIDNKVLIEIALNPSMINNWKNLKGIIYLLKNDYYLRQLRRIYKNANKEASEKGLSKTEPAVKNLSKEEAAINREKRKQNEKIKEEIFKPVRQAIQKDYGENAVNFIMSNRLIDELLREDKSNLRNYKKQLFLHYGKAKGIEKWL